MAYLDENAQPRMVVDSVGDTSFPSAVSFAPNRWRVGADAVLFGVPENTVVRPLELIGKPYRELLELGMNRATPFCMENGQIVIDAHRVFPTVEDVLFAILDYAKTTAEAALCTQVDQAVIAVPDGFGDVEKVILERCARRAGLSVSQMLNQTTAAAFGCRFDIGPKHDVIVVDVGAAHASAAYLVAGNNGIDTTRIRHCRVGTAAMELAIAQLVARSVRRGDYAFLASADPVAREEMIRSGGETLARLDHDESAEFSVGRLDYSMPGRLVVDVSRATFESAIQAELGELQRMIDGLYSRGSSSQRVTSNLTVLLIGGGSGIPAIRRLISNHFGVPVFSPSNIDARNAVALGAAVKGGILEGRIRSTSIERTVHDLGTFYGSYIMDVLIPKGTPIPITVSKRYSMRPGPYMEKVYQYVGPLATGQNVAETDRNLIVLKEATVQLTGNAVLCTFAIDHNGVAKFTATDTASGKEFILTGFEVK